MLPGAEMEFLNGKFPGHTVVIESQMICVVVPDFRLAPGLNVTNADLLLRLAPGFPDIPPDMWWFSPSVFRADGSRIPATEHIERHLGRDWQRWSRHLDAGRWMSGRDSLESYMALVSSELEKAARVAA